MNRIKIAFLGVAVSMMSCSHIPEKDRLNLETKASDFLQLLIETESLKDSGEINKIAEEYFLALKEVHDIVKKSTKIESCINLSAETISSYQSTFSKLSSDVNFTPSQLNVFKKQQNNIISGIAKNIEGLNNIIINTGMSLSDKERLDAIDTYHARIVALHNKSRGLNFQMLGESETINKRKEQKRLERELLR